MSNTYSRIMTPIKAKSSNLGHSLKNIQNTKVIKEWLSKFKELNEINKHSRDILRYR